MGKTLILSLFMIMACAGCSTHYHNALCNRDVYYAKWKDKCDEYSDTRINTAGKIALALAGVVATSYRPPEYVGGAYNSPPVLGPVTPNAYGSGVGMDATGRPVTLQGGSSNSYIQRENAYGPGVHMDQYGAPVRWK